MPYPAKTNRVNIVIVVAGVIGVLAATATAIQATKVVRLSAFINHPSIIEVG